MDLSSQTQTVVDETLSHIQKTSPTDYQHMENNPNVKEAVIQAASQSATKHLTLDQHIQANPTADAADILAKHLSEEHLENVKAGLSDSHSHLKINKHEDGSHSVDVIHSSSGEKLMPTKQLNSVESIKETTCVQIANVITDVVSLLLQIAGVKVATPSKEALTKMADEIVPVINEVNQGLVKAIDQLTEGFKKRSAHDIAHAIFEFVKELHPFGVLVKIAKSFCADVSIEGGLKAGAMITATIIAAIFTDGRALIPKIKLALHSAWDFMKKLENVHKLKTLQADHEAKQNSKQ